jgi:hypothetical protein
MRKALGMPREEMLFILTFETPSKELEDAIKESSVGNVEEKKPTWANGALVRRLRIFCASVENTGNGRCLQRRLRNISSTRPVSPPVTSCSGSPTCPCCARASNICRAPASRETEEMQKLRSNVRKERENESDHLHKHEVRSACVCDA